MTVTKISLRSFLNGVMIQKKIRSPTQMSEPLTQLPLLEI